MYLSKSSLSSFSMCPKKFEYQYMDKIQTETSEAAQRGIEIHDFCAKFYDNLIFLNGSYTVDPNFYEAYTSECLPDAVPQIENFLIFERERWEICKQLCPENPKKLFIPLFRERKLFSEKLQQVTILDRLDLRPDGNYTLVEIKSGKFNTKPWKLTELRRELTFEKLTAENSEEFQKEFPNKIVDFVVFYPRSLDILNESFSRRTQTALERLLFRMRRDIKNFHFPCNVAYHCKFCDFAPICNFSFNRQLRVK